MRNNNVIRKNITDLIERGVTTINLMEMSEFRHMSKEDQRKFATWYLNNIKGKHGMKNLALNQSTWILTIA